MKENDGSYGFEEIKKSGDGEDLADDTVYQK